MNAKRLPLEGVRVIEFSHMIMGPSCGLILADLGADVIKVEPVGGGDKTRSLTGMGAGFFPMFNRNKRSLAIDLRSVEGIRLVKELLAEADVVTENFRLGALEAMGLGYDELSKINPRLVYCSLKGFLSGPYDRRTALDEIVQMMGGLAYMTGPPGQPLRAGASVNDIMGGMFAVIGILAALYERQHTGHGQLVRSALFENNVFLMGQHMAQYEVTGLPAPPMPARLSAWAVYDLFETADNQQIFVGVVTDTQWQSFCSTFSMPDLAQDPSLRTNKQRVHARDRIMPKLRHFFRNVTRAEALDLCEKASVPFAQITRPEELYDDVHLNQSPGALINVSLRNHQNVRVPALPLEMDGERLGNRLNAPGLGEHTAEIISGIGGSSEMIARLVASGVLGIEGT